nr:MULTISPECIES: cyd operon protein YbgE [Vibrio]
MSTQVAKFHSPMDKTLFKVLSLALGFYHLFSIMWNPESYADSIGGFNAIVAPLIIWAMCSSMVYGVGFKPRFWVWQLLFSPYISLPILVIFAGIRLLA